MVNRLINLRLEDKLLKAIDFEVSHGFWGNRTEFVKDALKFFLEERKKQALIASLRKGLGAGKRLGIKEPTREEMLKIKEESAMEMLKARGLL